jgi:hypothetical protein
LVAVTVTEPVLLVGTLAESVLVGIKIPSPTTPHVTDDKSVVSVRSVLLQIFVPAEVIPGLLLMPIVADAAVQRPLIAVTVILVLVVGAETLPTVSVVFSDGPDTEVPANPETPHVTLLTSPLIVVVPISSHNAVGGVTMVF